MDCTRRSLISLFVQLRRGDRMLAHAVAPKGYVLSASEGEHLVHFNNSGNIFIKVDPVRGSGNFALGTQQLPVGADIPIHRHLHMNEVFYVLDGSGTFILNDARHPFEKGGTIFIPKNAWHGFASTDQELLLLWVLCHEYRRSKRRFATVREMKVGPSGSAIRSLIPSHRELLWAKAMVVSVAEKSGR